MKEPRADPEQLRDLGIQFGRHGITDRSGRLRLVSDHVGRPVHSMSQLSWTEAAALQQRLRRLPVGQLQLALARLVRAEEQAATERARRTVAAWICGRGGCTPLTEADLEDAGRQLTIDGV
jgi:hypothetical protein